VNARVRAVLVVCAVLALFGATACGSSKPKAVAPPPPTNMRGHTSVEIDAVGNQFTPVDVVVDVGTKVTWLNKDSVAHNVKKSADALDFGAAFGTDTFNPGATYSFTFAKAGTFFYTCTIHTLMSGKVTVDAKA
jgi:plastocyanin